MATRYKLQQFDWGFRCYDSQTEEPIEGELARYEIPIRLEKAVRWGASITQTDVGLEISRAVNPDLKTFSKESLETIKSDLLDPDFDYDTPWTLDTVNELLAKGKDEYYFVDYVETTLEANTAEGGTI